MIKLDLRRLGEQTRLTYTLVFDFVAAVLFFLLFGNIQSFSGIIMENAVEIDYRFFSLIRRKSVA